MKLVIQKNIKIKQKKEKNNEESWSIWSKKSSPTVAISSVQDPSKSTKYIIRSPSVKFQRLGAGKTFIIPKHQLLWHLSTLTLPC